MRGSKFERLFSKRRQEESEPEEQPEKSKEKVVFKETQLASKKKKPSILLDFSSADAEELTEVLYSESLLAMHQEERKNWNNLREADKSVKEKVFADIFKSWKINTEKDLAYLKENGAKSQFSWQQTVEQNQISRCKSLLSSFSSYGNDESKSIVYPFLKENYRAEENADMKARLIDLTESLVRDNPPKETLNFSVLGPHKLRSYLSRDIIRPLSRPSFYLEAAIQKELDCDEERATQITHYIDDSKLEHFFKHYYFDDKAIIKEFLESEENNLQEIEMKVMKEVDEEKVKEYAKELMQSINNFAKDSSSEKLKKDIYHLWGYTQRNPLFNNDKIRDDYQEWRGAQKDKSPAIPEGLRKKLRSNNMILVLSNFTLLPEKKVVEKIEKASEAF